MSNSMRFLSKVKVLSVAVTTACAFSAMAQPLELVQDGGFNTDSFADGAWGNFSASSPWHNQGTSAGNFNPTAAAYAAHDNFGVLAYGNAGGTIVQELNVPLASNSIYQFSVDLGWRADSSLNFGGMAVSLMTDSGLAIPITISPVSSAATDTQGVMQTYTGTLNVDANIASHANMLNSGENIKLVLRTTGTSSIQTNLDNVSLTVTDIDADNDGISDEWELANGLNPADANDAVLDPDGDGATNLLEFREDTDPADASNFPVGLVAATGKNIVYVETGNGGCPNVGYTSTYKDCISVTITTTGGQIKAAAAGGSYACGQGFVRIARDGTTELGSELITGVQGQEDFGFSVTDTVPAGTYTYKLQAKDRLGDRCLALDNGLLVVEEVK
ncbi:hypothetical protein SG34_007030 [Thalassomonas viridans]|uniref:Uncharacterized protein n=1 Tax=Thalassomonas viridans TaxID=137584 RepID=A0AAE9Z7D7_9GAMM|nr:hypothetical protein [Thalassomonas viridans]WDE06653.1 hypothetical protein SG34_007030 [Thalassomonas viridans]